ncbi:MAG: hypothetical protein ABI304_06525 [Rudaea sp.]
MRKPGKMLVPAIAADCALEYGADRLEIQVDAMQSGACVVLVDD